MVYGSTLIGMIVFRTARQMMTDWKKSESDLVLPEMVILGEKV